MRILFHSLLQEKIKRSFQGDTVIVNVAVVVSKVAFVVAVVNTAVSTVVAVVGATNKEGK